MEKLLGLFLYLIGILWIAIGTLTLVVPDMMRKKLFSKMMSVSLKKLSIIPLVIGVILLLASSVNRHTVFVIILGILAIAKGIYGIVSTEQAAKLTEKFVNAKKNIYRIYGIIIILIGSIVLTGL